MAAKPTTSLRDRRLSPSSSPLHLSSSASRPGSLKTPLSDGPNASPTAKKGAPNYLKPKAATSFEPSPQRTSSATSTTTTSATSKTQLARRQVEKLQLPSNHTALQRSPKPASPALKLSSHSRLNGDKTVQTVIRSGKTSSVSKPKGTSSAPVKKKEASISIATPPQVKFSSDNETLIANERLEPAQTQSRCKKVVESLKELNIEGEVKVEDHIENYKDGEVEDREEVLEPQVFDEIPKQSVVLKEVPKQVGVVVAATTLEKWDEGQKVEAVARQVEPEVRKPRLGTPIATVVAATPAMKKDTPRSNDVIEETKSKLMGTRRNKVLALVGAFETVISLQEPESQPIQKANQVQHCHQILQVEQNLENKKDQPCVASQKKQEDQEAQNSRLLEGGNGIHEGQESQGNGEHQNIVKEKENAMVKQEEEAIEALERRKEVKDELLNEEEVNEALEIRKVEEDVLVKGEADEALQNRKVEDEESIELL